MENKIALLALLISSAVVNVGNSQNFNRCLEVKLSLEASEVGFLEPIGYNFSVKNRCIKKLKLLEPHPLFYNPIMEYREINNSEWTVIANGTTINLRGFTSTPEILLKAGCVDELNASFIGFFKNKKLNDQINYCFEQGKTYIIRGVYYPTLKGEKTVITDEIYLKITIYQNQDKEALEWLIGLPVPHFLFDFTRFTLDRKKEALYVVENFPESKFREWAELQLLVFEITQRSISSYQTFDASQDNTKLYNKNIQDLEADIQKYNDLLLRSKEVPVKNIIISRIQESQRGIEAYKSFLYDGYLDREPSLDTKNE